MKRSNLVLALVAALGCIGSAVAADGAGLSLSGNVHASSDFEFRGQSLTGNTPTLGAGLTVGHTSGAYVALGEDTVNLQGVTGTSKQYLTSFTAGYGTALGDVKLGVGATRYLFNGANGVSALSFSEVSVTAGWNGLSAALYRNVNGSEGDPARLAKGDTFGSLGYTYQLGQAHVGADLGYYWYDKDANPVAKNGVAVRTVRAGYAVNEHLDLGVAYQVGGKDVDGADQEGNHKARVSLSYRF